MDNIENFKTCIKKDEYKSNTTFLSKLISIIDINTRFLCIGTDRVISDLLGPYLGSLLTNDNRFKHKIYGTIDNPIHALNVESMIENLLKEQKDEGFNIIAIDSCVSSISDIGTIILDNKPINPGGGCGKKLSPIGDYSIKGVITDNPSNYLNNTIRFKETYAMTHYIYENIIKAVIFHEMNAHGTFDDVEVDI